MGLGLGWKLKDIRREGMGMKKGYTLKWWNMMGDERNSYTLENLCEMEMKRVVCPSGMVLWDVDEKKMGCPIRMGCKVDEKEKCIPKKDGLGWGWKKIGMPKKDGMPRGWKEKGIHQRRMV